MISIKDLKFSYSDNKFSINIPNLLIKENETIAVQGPSGTGKSTLLNLMAGLLTANSGAVSFNEQALSNLSKSALNSLRLNNFGIIFQQANLVGWMSVLENITLPSKLSQNLSFDLEYLDKLLDTLEIEDLKKKKCNELSVGEQMRVSTIRALVSKPKVILADEPTASLDPKLKEKVLNLLLEENQNNKSTLIFVSHDKTVLDNFEKKLCTENWEFK